MNTHIGNIRFSGELRKRNGRMGWRVTIAWGCLVLALTPPVMAQQWSMGSTVPVTTYRLEYRTVYDEERRTAYRLQYETSYEEREVTVQRPEWVTENRQRRVTVARPIVETSMRENRRVVHKPVWETSMEERRRQVTRYVSETSTREERFVVHRPVWETQEREQQQVVRRAVTDTVMQQQQFTTMEPVTTMRTQYVDQGGFVDHQVFRPGEVRNRLNCLPGGYYQDPGTGQTVWRRRGLHWVASQDPGRIETFRQYVPNVVAQQVPQTTFMPRVVTQETPVQVTRFVDEVVTHRVPVQVCRMEAVEEVRQIPVTFQRPVTEEVVEQVPVRTFRWVAEEVVEQIPVTTRRVVHEEHVEEVPVRVCRMVTETQVQRVPRTVAKWVPYETRRLVPRTVVMRVPVETCGPAGVTMPAPPPYPSTDSSTTTRRIPLNENGTNGNGTLENGDGRTDQGAAGEKSLDSHEDGTSGTANGASPSDRRTGDPGDASREPQDSDPTGQPRLNGEGNLQLRDAREEQAPFNGEEPSPVPGGSNGDESGTPESRPAGGSPSGSPAGGNEDEPSDRDVVV